MHKTRPHNIKGISFHFRKKIKVKGKETDVYKCKKCEETLPPSAFHLHNLRPGGVYGLATKCRRCQSSEVIEINTVKKNATPKPERCECCHIEGKKLQTDHLHGSTTFRGWLCRNCNTGMGVLGDNLEGILQAAIYLENDKDKIIETLDKVYNEMFARTQ